MNKEEKVTIRTLLWGTSPPPENTQQKPCSPLHGLIVDPLKNSDQDQQQKDKFFQGI